MTTQTTHKGSCHCGAVRYEVTVDLASGAGRCNCSICTKVGGTGVLVKPADFTWVSDPARTSTYRWGGQISTRHFCPTCGIHCVGFGHLAELGGDFVSVNLNTLDGVELGEVPVKYWDGRHDNWQAGPRATAWPILASGAA
ncbi:MAG: GFA family protein [Deltaproteobacteria bacterium]|nr:GFA family protein [Deltaproteobacteria bacterium]